MEARLSVRLLEKRGRELVATESGRRAYEHLSSGMELMESAFEHLISESCEVRGSLRVGLPYNFYRGFVGQVAREFLEKHPKVKLEIALDHGRQPPETDRDLLMTFDISGMEGMIARPLFKVENAFFASPKYLLKTGPLETPTDLENLDWISVDHVREVLVYHNGTLVHDFTIRPKLIVNDINAVIEAVEKGAGIAALPINHIPSNTDIVHILPGHVRGGRQAYLVYRERQHQPLLLTLFVESLLCRMREIGIGK